jgi:small subunit ribosomal protein S16
MLKIRLRRVGKKGTPHYRVVVAEEQSRRDGDFIDNLGSYDPHAEPPAAILDAERTADWIKKGAQPSDAAAKILKRAGIIDADGKIASAPAAPAAASSPAAAETATTESES